MKLKEIYPEFKKVESEVQAEIDSRPQYANFGKKGCLRRIKYLGELEIVDLSEDELVILLNISLLPTVIATDSAKLFKDGVNVRGLAKALIKAREEKRKK